MPRSNNVLKIACVFKIGGAEMKTLVCVGSIKKGKKKIVLGTVVKKEGNKSDN